MWVALSCDTPQVLDTAGFAIVFAWCLLYPKYVQYDPSLEPFPTSTCASPIHALQSQTNGNKGSSQGIGIFEIDESWVAAARRS